METNATTTLGGSQLVDLGTGLSGMVTGLSLMFADATCTAGFCDNPVPFQLIPYDPDTLKLSSNDHEHLRLYRSSGLGWQPDSIRNNLGQFLFAGTDAQTGEPARYKLDPRKGYVLGVRSGSDVVFGPSMYGVSDYSGRERFAKETFLNLEYPDNEPVPAFILHGDILRYQDGEFPSEEEFEIELAPGEEIIYQRLPAEAVGGAAGAVGIAFDEGDPRGEAIITRVVVHTSEMNRNLWSLLKFDGFDATEVSERRELNEGFTEFNITAPFRLNESVRTLLGGEKRYVIRLVRVSNNGFSPRNPSLLIAGDTDGAVETETGQANPGRRTEGDPVITLVGHYEPLPPECCSSVAFIPGLQASRLYLEEGGGENRLWEPNTDADGEKLFMNSLGESINEVYTKDVVDEGLGVVNIYKNFIEEMDGLVAEGEVAEWQALPYDWRYNVFDVVRQNIALPDGETYRMVEAIEELAESSNSGQVTLITHSNGGLVAKALIIELEAQGKSELIDKLVLVAVPQLGTPKAVASILHGDYQGKGFGPIKLLTKETARELGENVPGGYGLLPSEGYFEKVVDPVVVFDEDSSTTAVLRARYDLEITDANTLDSFMLGEKDSREKPDRDDLLTPTLANGTLLSQARFSQDILDDWIPPENIEVTEIVGWGLPTLKGVEYKDKEVVSCANSFPLCFKKVILDHVPLFTVDGDETVVVKSAAHMDTHQSYYLNLWKYNQGRIIGSRAHASILEVSSILSLISSMVKDEESDFLPPLITEISPSTSEVGDSLRLSVHSPVSIGVRDESGNFTGVVDDSDLIEISEEISNSFYLPFGDGKYVGVPVGEEYEVELIGEDTGLFTLSVERVSGDEVIEMESFTNIPVTKDLKASLDIDFNGEIAELSLDVNADGQTDVSLGVGEGFSSTDYIAVLSAMIENSNVNKGIQNSLLVRLSNAEKNLEKENSGKSVEVLLDSMIQSLQDQQADEIIQIINILRTVLSN